MNYIFHDYIKKFCAVYFNDIIIFSNSVKEHKKHVKLIFKAFKEHEIVTSQFKSILFADEIEFLKYKIFSKEIQVNFAKFDKINNYSIFHFVIDIKFFLNFVNYVVMFDFISDLTDYFFILIDFTKKNISFIWKFQHQHAFKTIKWLIKSI